MLRNHRQYRGDIAKKNGLEIECPVSTNKAGQLDSNFFLREPLLGIILESELSRAD